jgi:hypothetical protein
MSKNLHCLLSSKHALSCRTVKRKFVDDAESEEASTAVVQRKSFEKL